MTAAAIRAGDADRDRVTRQLQAACAAGTLTAHELEDRLDKALRAVLVSDLDDLVRDLPPEPPPTRTHIPPVASFAAIFTLLNVACIALWLAGGAHGNFWPKWVLLASAVRLAAYASHQRSDHASAAPLWLLGPLGLLLTHLLSDRRARGPAPAPTHTAPGPDEPHMPWTRLARDAMTAMPRIIRAWGRPPSHTNRLPGS